MKASTIQIIEEFIKNNSEDYLCKLLKQTSIPKDLDLSILLNRIEKFEYLQKTFPDGLTFDSTCEIYEEWSQFYSTRQYTKEDRWLNNQLTKVKIQIANKYRNVWLSTYRERDSLDEMNMLIGTNSTGSFVICSRKGNDPSSIVVLFESKDYAEIEMNMNRIYNNIFGGSSLSLSSLADREDMCTQRYTEVYDYIQELKKEIEIIMIKYK